MSDFLPLEWDDKVNSPELVAFIQQYGANHDLSAEEINQLRDGINELFEKLNSIKPYINDFVSEPSQQEFEIPTGYIVNSVFLNRTFLIQSEYTFVDNILTIIETLETGTIISTR